MPAKQFSQEKVIEMVKSLEKLKDVDGIGYTLYIVKNSSSNQLYINAGLEVNMLEDNMGLYLESIQQCHKKIESLGFENAKLTSSNDSDGVSRAYVWSEMRIE